MGTGHTGSAEQLTGRVAQTATDNKQMTKRGCVPIHLDLRTPTRECHITSYNINLLLLFPLLKKYIKNTLSSQAFQKHVAGWIWPAGCQPLL